MKTAIRLVERGFVPTSLVRHGIRRLIQDRLREQESEFADGESLERWVAAMRSAPVALVPEKANEQHYEVPPAFFEIALGAQLKYSGCYYPDEHATLDEAEEAMLALTAERARLADGQDVLELGCGWGSLSLWMAKRFPGSRITAVSNSGPQREHILARAKERGLENLQVLTRDMNAFEPEGEFDRVVSVEMFEHMRNWEALVARIAPHMREGALMFLHVFAHERYAYPFEVKDESDWMSEHFFTGGMMPSHDLLDRLDLPLEVEDRWVVDGTHYARTAEDWLRNLERRKNDAMIVLAETYGASEATRWYHRWRMFFLACAELFGYAKGSEWIVSHQLLRKPAAIGETA